MAEGMQPRGYSLVRALSPGPVFATWLVVREADGASCVVKRPARGGPEARRQLAREAEILHALRGTPVVPRLMEQGQDERGAFVVMRQVPHRVLGAATGATASWVARAARAMFVALAAVHEARDAAGPLGVVHGDLTPGNVYVADDAGSALLGDFGLARYRDGPAPDDGAFRGTLLYAAPELARGERDVDRRADLFSLAASLLHVATGAAPRAASSAAALLASAAEAPIDAYHALPPSPLAAALLACIAFDRDARPARARDVVVLIDRA